MPSAPQPEAAAGVPDESLDGGSLDAAASTCTGGGADATADIPCGAKPCSKKDVCCISDASPPDATYSCEPSCPGDRPRRRECTGPADCLDGSAPVCCVQAGPW